MQRSVRFCLVIFTLLFVATSPLEAQTDYPALNGLSGTPRWLALDSISSELRSTDPEAALILINLGLSEAESDGTDSIQGVLQNTKGNILRKLGESEEAIKHHEKALQLFGKNSETKGVAIAHMYIGQLLIRSGQYDDALAHLLVSQKIADQQNDPEMRALVINNIGLVYDYQNQFDEALDYYQQALDIYIELERADGQANQYNNIGVVYDLKGEYDEALKFYRKSLAIEEALNNRDGIAGSLTNIGLVLQIQGNTGEGINHLRRALELYDDGTDIDGQAAALNNLAEAYRTIKRYDEAIDCLEKSLLLTQKSGAIQQTIDNYNIIKHIHQEMGNYEKAYDAQERQLFFKDSTQISQKSREIEEMKAKYRSAQSEKALQKAKAEKSVSDLALTASQLAQEQTTSRNYLLYGIISVLLLGGGWMAFSFWSNKKHNARLTDLNLQLGARNKDITDSIKYAKRIQDAMLPEPADIEKALKESFVIFQPRDIVSGDFFWMYENEKSVFLAVADATGHGVPGAFVSMLCHDLLNQAIIEKEIHDPALALDHVHEAVKERLRKDSSHVKANDGMDIALVVLNKNMKTAQFSGAHNPLLILRSKEIIEHKGDRMAVGGDRRKEAQFTTQHVAFETGDTIYLFTDGFKDQFGGENGKKFMYKPFKRLLQSVSPLPMKEQPALLMNAFYQWKGDHQQLDDLCLLGFRIS